MRIAFLGKGGSGKTTMTAAFVKYLSKKDHVVAIDADLNVNLRDTLGLSGEIQPLGDVLGKIAEYVKGDREDCKDTTIVGTTPPALKSRFIIPSQQDSFLQQYAIQSDNISLLSIGTFTEKDIGHNCYHTKLGSLSLVLRHTLDKENEFVVVDATAGVDNVSTSLFFSYDLNFFVVEPTMKSISVYTKFKEMSKKYPSVHLQVIANKIESDDDLAFIQEAVGKENVVAAIPRSQHVKNLEKGDTEALEKFCSEIQEQLDNIVQLAQTQEKDWETYHTKLKDLHVELSKDWWDGYFKQDISSQGDDDFTYQKAFEIHRTP